MSKDLSYVQQRLDSLHEIDTRIVSLLSGMSEAVSELQLAKQTNDRQRVAKFKESVGKCYGDLSYTAVHLRREIRFLSDRMNSKADSKDFTMLPVQIDKKATWVNKVKLREELKELRRVLGEEEVVEEEEDEEMESPKETVKETTEGPPEVVEIKDEESPKGPTSPKKESSDDVEIIKVEDKETKADDSDLIMEDI